MGLFAMDIALKSLRFLSIDCQATGNNPINNHLLEIGWLAFKADAFQNNTPFSPQTYLIQPPKDFVLPAHITKLTGINSTHFQHCVSDGQAMAALNDQAHALALEQHLPACIAVIHYARYEIPFLNHLFEKNGGSLPLPMEVICTHLVASRILPHLPRKGLRAVAGYLGYSMPMLKRCEAHLAATAFIWCNMLELLADREGVHTVDQLRHWLKNTKNPAAVKTYPMSPDVRSGLPNDPGIYRMKRSNGDILYIGKATSLKKRVNSYFQNSRHHSENKLEMLTQATDLDYTITPSALEASLQETDEIKRLKPPYNIALSYENRCLFFVSRSFDIHASTRNHDCRLGPVPSMSTFAAAHEIIRYIHGQLDHPDVQRIMDMPASRCPDEDCFISGMALFMETYGGGMRTRPYGQAVLHVGRISWINRAREKAARQNLDQEEKKETTSPKDFVWTPGAVAKALESICRRCGFLLRRARWLTMLSESTVAWKVSRADSDRLNILRLEAGRISDRCFIRKSHPIPLPPNPVNPYPNRQMNINLETYDRVRVLTTEIRRLIADNRMMCIRLGKKRNLSPDQLRILLGWI